jgi:multicomponent Na+:H+ antiporter subunit D
MAFLPAFWFLNIGMFGSVMTGDLFNLYVWFEMMLIGSFILMGLGNPKVWLSNKFKYVVLNLIGTLLFLTAIAFVYGMAGTLNMADLAVYFGQAHQPPGLDLMVMLFLLLGLSVKAALFPVFSWLPASYHTTSATASAIMGGLLSKIGVYVMIRLFTLIYPLSHAPLLRDILLILAALTMVIGVLGAAAQYNYRRILSFHIISQIGYMIFGLALNTPLALAATLFFIAHNILAKTSLFLTGGVAQHVTKNNDIRHMGGLYRQTPSLAALFLISALALAGIPPLTGFWAKFLLIQESLSNHFVLLAGIALAVSILTLYSMLKIWAYAYLSRREQLSPYIVEKIQYLGLIAPIIFIVGIILLFSFLPQPLYSYCESVAQQLFNAPLYIQTVLGATS